MVKWLRMMKKWDKCNYLIMPEWSCSIYVSNVCIVRGTIDDTVIEDGVKIDNLSHVAHNCVLEENAVMAFPCFLGGSSRVEQNGYIAQGVVRNQCTVHENGFVGMGAVVTKDVPANTIVVGNPAKPFIRK